MMQLTWLSVLGRLSAGALLFQSAAPTALTIQQDLERNAALERLTAQAALPPKPMPGVPRMDVGRLPDPTNRFEKPARLSLTLLDEVGRAPAGIPSVQRKEWLDRAHSGQAGTAEKARLQIWLGEYDMAVRREPAEAAQRFLLAARLASSMSPEQGLANYDLAVANFYEGGYREATTRLKRLLDGRLTGFDRNVAAMFARHASSCAAFHDERAAMGIVEPVKLDPLCGVSAVAVCLRSLGLPYDEATVAKKVRHDGEGSTMRDLLIGARRMGLASHAFSATDEALRNLPMPVVAHIERDHFVSVVKADEKGVRYVCSDCGRWPGAEQFVNWKQWRALVPDGYLSVSTKGSAKALAFDYLTASKPALYAMTGGPSPALVAMSRLVSRVPHGAVKVFPALLFYGCGVKPVSNHCTPFTCCPLASGGGPGGGAKKGFSALAGDPVNLATGEEEYRPDPDLTVYNPKGPNVEWTRLYNSLSNGGHGYTNTYSSDYGFGLGWSHNYNVGVNTYVDYGDSDEVIPDQDPTALESDGPEALIEYPQVYGTVVFENESKIQFNGKLADATHPVTNMTVPNGIPLLIQCVYNPTTHGYYMTVTFKDRTKWECEEQNDGVSPFSFHRLHRIYDQVGNYIAMHYGTFPGYDDDRYVLLDRIDDSAGQSLISFNYNLYGHVKSASDRYGRSVYYTEHATISAVGDVSQIVATGTTTPPVRYRYTYVLIGNGEGLGIPYLKTISVPSPTGTGLATGTFNYTSQGYIDNIVDANGNKTILTQTPGNTTKVSKTDAAGNVVQTWTASFDNSMSDTGVVNATGQAVAGRTYGDANDPFRPSSVTDGNGRSSSATYDHFGNMLTSTTPKGTTTIYTYDYSQFPLGELASVKQGSKTATFYTYYEPSGLLHEVLSPIPGQSGTGSTQTATYFYNALGNVTQLVCPGNNAVPTRSATFGYTTDGSYTQSEALGRPILITDALGKQTHFRYDARGNITSVRDALGFERQSSYNLADQIVTTVLPATGTSGTGSSTQTSTYLYMGGPTIQSVAQNESGTVIRTVNVALGGEGETLSISGSTESSSMTYDAAYHTKTLRDGNNNAATYTYDLNGRATSISLPGQTGSTFDKVQFTSYDPVGNILSRTDGNGRITNYSYTDTDGHLTSVTYPDSTANNVSLSYDAFGRSVSVTDGTGTEAITYDDRNNKLTSVHTYTGLPAKTIAYTFWPDSSRKTMTTPSGTWTYGYDAVGRYVSLASPAGTSSSSYFDNGWPSSRTLPNGVVTTYGYNAAGMPTALLNQAGSTVLSQFGSFSYDGMFNITGLTASVPGAPSQGGTTSYAYDTKNRVTQETSARAGGYAGNFAYDAAGNATTFKGTSRTFNADNQCTGTGFVYDGNGSPTTYGGSAFGYDIENRLTSVGSSWTARYRADGLRAWKQTGATKTYFLYDGGKPVLEMDASGAATATNVYAPDGLVARQVGGTWTQYVFDPQGNVAQRLNSAGVPTSSSIYDTYGTESVTGSPTDPFGYNARWGYQFDRETGLYYCQNRYYDPGRGRWVTRDPIEYWGGMNVYGYLAGQPNDHSDSLGMADLDDPYDESFNVPWIPPFNPAEDDRLCNGRRPRPINLQPILGIWYLECASCLKENGVMDAIGSAGAPGDKAPHFIGGCLARIRCGLQCPNSIGSLKELMDSIFGGTVSQADALATDDGWDYADGYLSGLSGEFGLNDVAFCKWAAKQSGWWGK